MLFYKSTVHHMLLYEFVPYNKSYYTEYTLIHIIIIWMTVCSDQPGHKGQLVLISQWLERCNKKGVCKLKWLSLANLLLIGPSDNQHHMGKQIYISRIISDWKPHSSVSVFFFSSDLNFPERILSLLVISKLK